MRRLAKEDPKMEQAYHILLIHGDDQVGVQTIKDGKAIPPTLYTSRPMTDEEIGRIIRLALEESP